MAEKVQAHFDHELMGNLSGTVGAFINIISKNADKFKLTPDEKALLQTGEKTVKYTSLSTGDIARDKLKEKWQLYQVPSERKAMVEAKYHKWCKDQRAMIRAAKRKTRSGTSAEAKKEEEDKIQEEDEEFLANLIDPVKVEGDLCYGINLDTLTIDYSAPLQYTGAIKLDLIDECVSVSPLTRAVDISKTLRAVLLKGAKVGWTRENIATLLKLFIKEHLPSSYSCLAYIDDPTEVWDAVCALIDFSSTEASILSAMRGLVRKKNQGIRAVLNSYKSLSFDLHEIKSPYSSQDDCVKRADKDSVKVAKHFMEDNLYKLIQGICDKQKHETKKSTTLDQIVDWVNKYEQSNEYRLKSDKTLEKFDIRDVSIFLLDPSLVEDDVWKGTKATVNVIDKGGENIYENSPGTMSSWSSMSGGAGDSFRTETPAGGQTSYTKGKPYSKGPTVTSPLTQRRRLYLKGRNAGDQRRSFSRGRIEVYDEKKRGFIPRPLSRSAERSSGGERGRTRMKRLCRLCNTLHPGSCHWYGKIPATKDPCANRCGGYHHKSICLGRRATTPGGTSNRSPSPYTPRTGSPATGLRTEARTRSPSAGSTGEKRSGFKNFNIEGLN